MALLSGTMRMAAFTGSTDSVFTRIAGRQGGRWAEQTVRAAYPQARRPPAAAGARPPADPAEALLELTKLREQGVITEGELERLRARLQA
jgi:hypothetical protein